MWGVWSKMNKVTMFLVKVSEPRWKLLRLLSTSEATQTEYNEKNCLSPRCTMWCSHKCCSCYSLTQPVRFFVTPWTTACQASLFFPVCWSLLRLMSLELVMLSNYLIFCCPILLLPSIFPSIRDFSNKFALCIRWPKYWSVMPSFPFKVFGKFWALLGGRLRKLI